MNSLAYFFRTPMDPDSGLVLFSTVHILMIALMLAGCAAIYLMRTRIREDARVHARVKWTLFTLLLIEQIAFYAWFIITGRFTWSESLPFFSCRIAMILILVAMVTNEPRAKALGVYFGLFGGFLALLLPDLFKYHWPHLQWICFFGGHDLLIWSASFFLAEGYTFTKTTFKHALVGVALYLLASNLCNLLIPDSNYAYVVDAPFLNDFLKGFMGQIGYTIFSNLLYVLLIVVIHFVARFFQNRKIIRHS